MLATQRLEPDKRPRERDEEPRASLKRCRVTAAIRTINGPNKCGPLRPLAASSGCRSCDEATKRESARDDGGQQLLVVEDSLSVFGHLLDPRQVGDVLGEEEIGADEQAARS
jgi:hypothetical protein